MSERINIDLIISDKKTEVKDLRAWIDIISFFSPVNMKCKKLTMGKIQDFNKDLFYKNIELELDEDDNDILIKDERNSISIYRDVNYNRLASLSCILEKDIFEENREYILSLINNFMSANKGIVAYACSLNDWFWQNNEDLNLYKLKGRSIENIKIKADEIFQDDKIVDIEYNPGHFHKVNGLWFGSCWRMWYGKEYFKYIPKPVLMNFKNCHENKLISDDCIRITLYESPWDYDKKENREKQWDFRRSVGIDEIVDALKEEDNNTSDDSDTSIEISEGKFEHGGVRLLKYYYDEHNNLVEKSKAYKSVTYELDQNGNIAWRNQN